jgi:hypothetical protein
MYDETLKDIAIRNLEQKAIGIVQTTVALAAQGYIVNRRKQIKLEWSSIILHAFENIDVLTQEQQQNIEVLYNKIYNS